MSLCSAEELRNGTSVHVLKIISFFFRMFFLTKQQNGKFFLLLSNVQVKAVNGLENLGKKRWAYFDSCRNLKKRKKKPYLWVAGWSRSLCWPFHILALRDPYLNRIFIQLNPFLSVVVTEWNAILSGPLLIYYWSSTS